MSRFALEVMLAPPRPGAVTPELRAALHAAAAEACPRIDDLRVRLASHRVALPSADAPLEYEARLLVIDALLPRDGRHGEHFAALLRAATTLADGTLELVTAGVALVAERGSGGGWRRPGHVRGA